MRLLRLCSLAAAVLLPGVLAGKPVVHKTSFKNLPATLFYFEDSPVLLMFDPKAGDVYRSDNDGQDWTSVEEAKGMALDMMEHPFDKDRAVIFTVGKEHWTTKDKGKTWKKFSVDLPMSVRPSPMVFSAANSNHVLYAGRECDPDDFFSLNCRDKTFYTKDWFETDVHVLAENTRGCLFAHGNKLFKEGPEDAIFCIVDGDDKYPEHRKLLVSNDFFQNSTEPKLDGYSSVKGLVGLAAVSKFIVAAVRSKGTDEMALYVSNNATTWDRAEFPQDHGGLKEDAYTILESTPHSIQVDVLTTSGFKAPVGELFTSNSNGTYFTRDLNNTNRNFKGLVDFEQIEGIEGIIMANIVANAEEVKAGGKVKKLKTKISFDDGKMDTWKNLKADGKELHLHSVTELATGGRVYSSRAPGLVMGVGNTGDYLDDYSSGDLYISDDAGITWSRTRTEAHKYEFGGAGSIIVAVFDEGFTNKVSYSKNHGKTWEDVDLSIEIRARLLTTTPDSTSLKFLLVGSGKDKEAYVFDLDFGDVFDKKICKLDKDNESKSDFEKWYARYDEDEKPDCLMGRKQYYWRRKKDADCNAGELYKEPIVENEFCKCQHQDFECDFNFVRDKKGKCQLAPNAKLPVPPNECKNPQDDYKGPSGYRKIPGNSCEGGVDDELQIIRKCDEAISTPSTGEIKSKLNEFHAKKPVEYFYLENAESASSEEETIFMMTDKQAVWVSHSGGKEWEHILKDAKVIAIYPHPHQYDHVYFITNSKTIHYTIDRGHSFSEMEAPGLPNRKGLPFLDFHPRKKNWFIWHGQKDCSNPMKCHTIAWYTITAGVEWHVLKSFSGVCKWVRSPLKETPDKLVFCEHAPNDDPQSDSMELLSSSDFFVDEEKHFDRIIGFAIMHEFIVVAGVKDDNSLQAFASVDGQTFAYAHFPHGFNVPHQTAYTVLDSDTHSVFLHVTVNDHKGYEYGSLLKSNSNGTNYVLSLDAVNRNERGFVDYEKMQSLEGIAIVNRVVNHKAAAKGEKKKLRSMITHNDGGRWDYIAPPAKDSEGNAYNKCSKNIEECSLNFHHYTERTDARHTFSSGSAIGLMMAVGSVGDELKGFADSDTFLTTDGGVMWMEVRKGQYLWEYGDQGSIIVIVDRAKPTNQVLYTLDEGKSWLEHKFGETMKVTDISTVSMDNSRKFLLWGHKEGGGEKFYTVHLDFSGITKLQCKLDEKKEDSDNDFFLWSPRVNGRCLFGHEAQYHRKIPERRCYIGRKLDRLQKTITNCTCIAEDFECDFNYERKSDNTCKLVQGLSPIDHSAVCKDPNVNEYYKPGYRRLPASTCQGGREMDKLDPTPCPGKHLKTGMSGFGLFIAVIIPIAAAVGIGYYVWTHLLNGRFGAIRLGEDNDSPLVQYPIIAISAVVAVALAIPSILSALGGWLASKFTRTRRYTTRNSFARGGDYSVVNNDEGELLGSDDDEV